MNKNKILIVSNGKENILEFHKELISQFIKDKYFVNIFNPSIDFNDLKLSFTDNEISQITVIQNVPKYTPKNFFLILYSLFITLKNDNYKYVISFMINAILISGFFSIIFKKTDFIGTIEGVGSLFEKDKNKINSFIKNFFISLIMNINLYGIKKLIFINSDNQKFFNENYSIVNKKKQLLLKYGNGIRVFKHEIRNYKKNKIIKFIMISRILEEKGIFEFIEASKKISSKIKNVSFTHIGGNPLPPRVISNELKKLINRTKHIKFLGQRNDVNRLLLDYDIMILPSYNEGFSAAIMEALVSGLFVITTDVPGCRQSIEFDYEGILVKHKDIKSLQHAIEDCCNNIKKIRNNALKIRKSALKKFDSVDSQKKIKDFIIS